jgi:Ca2+-binding RTX toxin-like protein
MPTVENAHIRLGNLHGNELDNELTVDGTAFHMEGFGGNDRLIVHGEPSGYGASAVSGGDGNDFISVGSIGIEFSRENDITGDGGNDTIGGTGSIDGGEGDDLISGGGVLSGGNGNDTIQGGSNDDFIGGGPGNDSLDGGAGNDTLDGETGADVMKGGIGNDTVDYSNCAGNLTIGIGTLADDGEAGEHDNVYLDIETVLAGSGNDTINGGDADNLIDGGFGNDSIRGNYGNDTSSAAKEPTRSTARPAPTPPWIARATSSPASKS